jgi:hypothetical protein
VKRFTSQVFVFYVVQSQLTGTSILSEKSNRIGQIAMGRRADEGYIGVYHG